MHELGRQSMSAMNLKLAHEHKSERLSKCLHGLHEQKAYGAAAAARFLQPLQAWCWSINLPSCMSQPCCQSCPARREYCACTATEQQQKGG